MKNIQNEYRALVDSTVQNWRKDIDIDCDEILANGTPAIFFARENGTHAIEMRPFERYPAAGTRVPYLFGTADRERILNNVGCILSCDGVRNAPLVIHFDGKQLRTIDHDKARFIIDEYKRAMRAMFKKHNGLKS